MWISSEGMTPSGRESLHMNLDIKITSSIQFMNCGNGPITKIVPAIGGYLAYGAKQVFTLSVGDCRLHERLAWLKGTLQLNELVARYFEPVVLAAVFGPRHPGYSKFTHEGGYGRSVTWPD